MNRMTLFAAGLALAGLTAAPAHAAFSGKNGRIAFQRPVGEQADLFTARPDGDGVRRLTRTCTGEERAEWSADGQGLAYARSAPSGEPQEIWTMSANGANRRALTTFGSTSSSPTWSPGGRIAYFTLRDFPDFDGLPPAEIYSMTAEGGDQQRLTTDEAIQTDPECPPTGARSPTRRGRRCPGRRASSTSGST